MRSYIENKNLDSLIIDIVGAKTERLINREDGIRKKNSQFLEKGYFVFELEEGTRNNLDELFSCKYEIEFSDDDFDANYWGSALGQRTVDALNSSHSFFAKPEQRSVDALRSILSSLAQGIEEQLKTPFAVVNCRAFSTRPSEDFGPTAWHFDGSSKFLRKLLVYPQPLSDLDGTIEIYDRRNNFIKLATSSPTAILYDASILLHRGRPGKLNSTPRPLLEITLKPSLQTDIEPKFSGQNARVPKTCVDDLDEDVYEIYAEAASKIEKIVPPRKNKQPQKRRRRSLLHRLRKVFSPLKNQRSQDSQTTTTSDARVTNLFRYVNIGGGSAFDYPSWINYDAIDCSSLERSLTFSDKTIIPLSMRTAELVYSSHCLEHLNDETVDRLLSEARRIVSLDGTLLIKLPDFEKVLASYRKKEDEFFDQHWGMNGLVGGWARKGISDTIAARAAFIFCGYWNEDYGGEFGGGRNVCTSSYHGPAVCTETQFSEILSSDDCHEISKILSVIARQQPDFHQFNHQNAWSRSQFEKLLLKQGFQLETTSTEEVLSRFSHVPTIREMEQISTYYCARPLV